MSIYYVDFLNGDDLNSGLSPEEPKKDHSSIDIKAGDSLLFRRGTVLRGMLKITAGTDRASIRYGAYGEGEKPIFCGSSDVSSSECWEATDRKNVWRCKKIIDGDVGNFVLDGECVATFRWNKNELSQNGDFYDSRFADGEQRRRNYSKQDVLFYCDEAPFEKYKSIECVSYGTRVLGKITDNIIIEDLCFMNSGVHALAGKGKNVTVRRCEFKNIGGCAWNSDLKIRFGNGVEFWNYGENVLVEESAFENVYDSCVTHQGAAPELLPAKNFLCVNNSFDTYGMAALELRDAVGINLVFKNNVCNNAGCGFAMLGEELPRSSEIWPQPMGHHIFLWRMEEPTDGGCVEITDNVFKNAPVGAAVYSIISQEAEKQFFIDRNKYMPNEKLLVRFSGVDFCDLEGYARRTGNDLNSEYIV